MLLLIFISFYFYHYALIQKITRTKSGVDSSYSLF